MKKALLFLCVATIFVSCNDGDQRQIGEEYDVTISEIEHDGHSYILFEGYGVVHNPNCGCMVKKEEK